MIVAMVNWNQLSELKIIERALALKWKACFAESTYVSSRVYFFTCFIIWAAKLFLYLPVLTSYFCVAFIVTLFLWPFSFSFFPSHLCCIVLFVYEIFFFHWILFLFLLIWILIFCQKKNCKYLLIWECNVL